MTHSLTQVALTTLLCSALLKRVNSKTRQFQLTQTRSCINLTFSLKAIILAGSSTFLFPNYFMQARTQVSKQQ